MFSACAFDPPNKLTLLFTRRVLDEHFSTSPIYFMFYLNLEHL